MRLLPWLIISLSLAACNRTAPEPVAAATATQSEGTPAIDTGDLDAMNARIARTRVPGYAGKYLRSDGTHVVLITADGDRDAARSFIAEHRAGKGLPAREPVFEIVRYDFAQLHEWSIALQIATQLDGILATWIADRRNAIYVGAEADALGRLAAIANAHGIPEDALVIEAGAPLEP